MKKKSKCPVCGRTEFEEDGDVCDVCGWFYDRYQEKYPDEDYLFPPEGFEIVEE